MPCHLSIFAFVACAFGIISKVSLPRPQSWSLPMFSSSSFSFWPYIYIFKFQLRYIYIYDILNEGLISFFQFPQQQVLRKMSFHPFCVQGTFVKSLFFIYELSILFHWSLSLFLCHYHAVLITVALQLYFEVR
jgi:hypothetical protein